jgi:hypothetical protein
LLEAIVAPEQLAILRDEARRAEHPQPLGALGIVAKGSLDLRRARSGQRIIGIDAEPSEDAFEGLDVANCAAYTALVKGATHPSLLPSSAKRAACSPLLGKGSGSAKRSPRVAAMRWMSRTM